MKQLVILLILVSSVFSAHAWTREADHGARLFARDFLSPNAAKEYQRLTKLSKNHPREKEKPAIDERQNKVSLDADLRSTTTYEGDVVVQLEQAAEVLRNRSTHSDKECIEALRSIWSNIIRLHNIALVRIEGNELSKGFDIYYHPGTMAEKDEKYNKSSKRSWATLWGKDLTLSFYGYTPQMWAEELRICHAADKEAFSAGTIRDWAADMGKECTAQLEWARPDMKLYVIDRTKLQPTVDRLMAKVGFRMAALLNDALK